MIGASAMVGAYRRLRPEALEVTPEEHREEFERQFPRPEKIDFRSDVPGPAGQEASEFATARALLGSLAGWLGGFVQEAQLTAQARAGAEAKKKESVAFDSEVRPERRIGAWG
jgi:hypothetical protein